MFPLKKMIDDSDDKEVKRKLTLASYIYKEIENEENAEKLEELISLIIEVFGKEPTTVPSLREFDSKVLQDFYNYLLFKCGMAESTSYDYGRRIARILREQDIVIEDLIHGEIDIEELIGKYLYGGGKEQEQNTKQHNAPSSALKKLKQYIDYLKSQGVQSDVYINGVKHIDTPQLEEELLDPNHLNEQYANAHIYLHELEGYHSFEVMNKHICEVEIRDRDYTVTYKENRRICDTEHKTINLKNYVNLIRVMRKYKDILNQDPTPANVTFPFGGAGSVSYEFEDKANYNDVWGLFKCDDRKLCEQAHIELAKVLSDIENQ